ARCVFAFGTGNSSIAGSMGDEEIERVDPASVLGSILQQALGTGMSATGIYDDGGGGHGTGEVSYSYLNTLTINAQYGYVYAFQIHCTTSCRASAAGYGSINGRYLATGSDMVFAAVSAALYCDFQCSIGTAYAAYRDRDAVAYALKNGDKRYQPVHGPSKAVHVIADYCGVLPGDYENSPTYIALKDQSPALPYDTGVKFKFGTYAQAPRQADTISALSSSDFLFAANLYPPPTSRDLNVVRDNPGVVGGRQVWFPSWTYDFSTLTSWKFDIIFAAVQNANVEHGSPVYNGAACRTYIQISDYIPGSSAGAHGDQFWIWHGGRTTGDYDLPETKLIFGYAGGRALTAAVD
ncbi:MAG TPA: hypothetical protein VFV11_03670, partial [Solimonas sp.]|nr:hypothetical protein [Solimonas sp.]